MEQFPSVNTESRGETVTSENELIVIGGPLHGSIRKAYGDQWPQSFLLRLGDFVHRYIKVGSAWEYKGAVKAEVS